MKAGKLASINILRDLDLYELEANMRLIAKGYADVRFSLKSDRLAEYEQKINDLCLRKRLVVASIDFIEDDDTIVLNLWESNMKFTEKIKIIKGDLYPEVRFKFKTFCNEMNDISYNRSLFLRKKLLDNKKIESVNQMDFCTSNRQMACVLVYPAE